MTSWSQVVTSLFPHLLHDQTPIPYHPVGLKHPPHPAHTVHQFWNPGTKVFLPKVRHPSWVVFCDLLITSWNSALLKGEVAVVATSEVQR